MNLDLLITEKQLMLSTYGNSLEYVRFQTSLRMFITTIKNTAKIKYTSGGDFKMLYIQDGFHRPPAIASATVALASVILAYSSCKIVLVK